MNLNLPALLDEARQSLGIRDHERAIRALDEAAALAPEEADVFLLLSEAHYALRSVEPGIREQHVDAALKRAFALGLKGWSETSLFCLARWHHWGYAGNGKRSLEEALALPAANDAALLFNQGLLKERYRNDADAALKDFSESLRLRPHPDAYRHRAQLHQKRAAPRDALRDCDAGLALDPRHHDLRRLRGRLRYAAKDWPAALEDWDALIEANPGERDGRLYRGCLSLRLGRLDSAAKDFEEFLRVLDARSEKYQEGVLRSTAEEMLSESPLTADAHRALGLAFWRTGRPDWARGAFAKALELDGRTADWIREQPELAALGALADQGSGYDAFA